MPEPSLKQKTAKGLFWGGLSNGIQQLLSLAFGVFLARVLDSSDYGIVGILAIFPAIATTIQDSGFTAALTNRKTFRHEDYNAVFWFNVTAGLVMYALLFLGAPLIARFFGDRYDGGELVTLSRVLFLAFLISSTGIAHNAILFKNMRVKEIAKINLLSLVLSGCVGVATACAGMGYWALVAQNIAFVTGTSLLRWRYSAWRPTLPVSFRPLKGMFSFSVKLLLTNIVNQINGNIFSAILGRYYTPGDVGFYTQGYKWMSMGQQSVGGMINGIAQPLFAQVGDDGERRIRVLRKMLAFTSFVSFPALLGLAFVSRELILITIGEKWLPSVPYLQLLCVFGAIWPILNLYFQVAISQGRSNIYLWSNIVFGVFQISVALLMIRYGIFWMVVAYVGGFVALLFVWQAIIKRLTGLAYRAAMREMLPYAGCAVAAMGIACYLTRPIENVYLLLLAKIAVTAALYLAVMRLCGSAILKECAAFVRNKIRK